jgi:uncharacterized protein DUF6976
MAAMMRRHLLEVDAVAALISRGETLLLAGDERRLRRLPRGRWIAGTIPYFMSDEGGVVDRRRIFVERLPFGFGHVSIRRYDEGGIARVYADLPPNTIGVIILPSGSPVHGSFAVNAPGYARFASAPLFGWVSGVHLSEIGTTSPKVFDGSTGDVLDRHAVVMHVAVPPGTTMELAILNIFEEGDGPAIVFPSTGFTPTTAIVDGRECNFAEYVRDSALDIRLPLVAHELGQGGVRINVSFQSTDARPVRDYVDAFVSALPTAVGHRIVFGCNCVLNYVHSALEGRRTGDIVGPITFGEIAYQLLNQTMVYLTVNDDR